METIAQRVIEKLGGAGKVAGILKIDVSNVHRWKYPRDRGGSEGRVRDEYQQPLLDYARKHGIDLTPEDFFEAPKGKRAA